jgi:hypothetical protein
MSEDSKHPVYKMSKEDMLYQLLKKEHGYYKAIQEIAREEYEKLNANHPISELKPLLKKKKILLSCISEIETAMTPLKRYWQNKSNRTDDASERIKLELDALNKLLKEILQLDLLSQKTLENHMLFLRERNKELDGEAKTSEKPSTPLRHP